MQKLIILGTGGNCIDILDTVNEVNKRDGSSGYECIGFLDDNRETWGRSFHGISVLGCLDSAKSYADCLFVNGIGSPNNFWRKKEIIARTQIPLDRFATLIHPTASVSDMSRLGRGTVIFQNVTVTSNVTVGDHVIVLPSSILSHDSIIGDYTCIAGGVCISGQVTIGESCYFGTNCAVANNIAIGDRCLVGMGSIVIGSVEENSVVVGNPAKFLRRTTEASV